MTTSTLDARTQREIHQSAVALGSLCDQIERGGIKSLDTHTAESIPAIINAASTALATARGADLESPLVSHLESELLRVSQLLRQVQRPSLGVLFTHILHTTPQRLWRTAPAQVFALLVLLCGFMLGYRTTLADPLLGLSYFPDATVGVSLSEHLLSFQTPMFANAWLDTIYSDVFHLVMSFDGQVALFFAAFGAAALVCVWIGGVVTPLLLLSMGAALGALLGIFPSDSQWDTLFRLLPAAAMSALAMLLAQGAGVEVIRALLPAKDGRTRRHRSLALQSALLCMFWGAFHVILAIVLTVLAVGPRNLGYSSGIFTIAWIALYIVYIGFVGSGLIWQAFPALEARIRRERSDATPYAQSPPKIHKEYLRLDLREGASLHVLIARVSDRLAAYLVDVFLVVLWGGALLLLARALYDDPSPMHLAVISAIFVTTVFAYFFGTEWRWQGQTIGKRLFEIRTVRLDGERLDSRTMGLRTMSLGAEVALPAALAALSYFATKRYVWLFVAIAVFGTFVSLVFPLFNIYRQRLADFMTGTVTIELPDATRGLLVPPPALAQQQSLDASLVEALSRVESFDDRQKLLLSSLVEQAQRGHFDGARSAIRALMPQQEVDAMSDADVRGHIEALYALRAHAPSNGAERGHGARSERTTD